MGEDTIQNLPVGRSFASVVNTIPGVSGRVDTQNGGSGGSPSVRGEGGYGNNYMIDGVSTRDPATKTSGAGVNFDAIEEIQVYTDGAPAEYGQFTGMMVNVVTRTVATSTTARWRCSTASTPGSTSST
ncbi:MAG: Plug domain-containing protein [Myxococcota bacterium]